MLQALKTPWKLWNRGRSWMSYPRIRLLFATNGIPWRCGTPIRPSDPVQLQAAPMHLLNDDIRRAQLGENTSPKVTNQYALPKIFARYINYWQSVLGV
jgi:hypothetical protein